MFRKIGFLILLLFSTLITAQVKIKGKVVDKNNNPLPFVNVYFKDTYIGTSTNDFGEFELETKSNPKFLEISFIGYETIEFKIVKKSYSNLVFNLKESTNVLKEVIIVTGKQPKKNNPAIAILQKIWKRKKVNGLKKFKQYKYRKYQKIEFDLNSIDEKFKKKKLFKGVEFVFNNVDTSAITGKTYLPIFLNESVSDVYGDNILKKEKEILKGNKNTALNNNQGVLNFIDDLYADYNIYDNYIKLFYKSFVSPLSETGVSNYNYYLADSTYINNKWCYNIIYYPRRKNELTFTGDFWVNDTTFAVKEINMKVAKNANINWVKDIYIEQEYDIVNDSVFLLKRDYFLSDFALNKKENSKGVYGKRTTLYNNYEFNIKKEEAFYKEDRYKDNSQAYNRDATFWEQNRLEKLNKDEASVYTMIDTLKNTKKFKKIYNITAALASGYFEIKPLHIDYGPLFSTLGHNSVEGTRIRVGGRTFFKYNDPWRVEGYTAYGFKDQKFKYGLQAKFLLNQKNRFILSIGRKEDIEQIGSSNMNSLFVLNRSNGSSSLVGIGGNDKLTKVKTSIVNFQAEPLKNLEISFTQAYKSLHSASPNFSLDYKDPEAIHGISSNINQFESIFTTTYYPGRKVLGHGVETHTNADRLRNITLQYTKGIKGFLNSDFNYSKLHFSYSQPWFIGGLGKMKTSIQLGKTFGNVPLALLNPVPGNQSYFSYYNTFNQLDFYEFVTDTYASFHMQHNFNGRIFSRIPLLRKLNLRAIVGFKSVIGNLSQGNIDLNSTNHPSQITFRTPSKTPYYEYSFGIGNIFKILQIDFNFRGNYLNIPNARKSGITFTTGLNF